MIRKKSMTRNYQQGSCIIIITRALFWPVLHGGVERLDEARERVGLSANTGREDGGNVELLKEKGGQLESSEFKGRWV